MKNGLVGWLTPGKEKGKVSARIFGMERRTVILSLLESLVGSEVIVSVGQGENSVQGKVKEVGLYFYILDVEIQISTDFQLPQQGEDPLFLIIEGNRLVGTSQVPENACELIRGLREISVSELKAEEIYLSLRVPRPFDPEMN